MSVGIVAVDTGVKTFQNWFDASGLIAAWDVGDKLRIYHAYDDLQSRWN